MSISEIRIVVFDLGGVMIRLAGGWEGACREAGISFRGRPLTPEQHALSLKWEAELEAGNITIEEYARREYEMLDGLYSLDELTLLYLTIIREEFPGITEIVQGLRAAGYQTACLSNTCDLHWPELTNPARYPGIGQLDHQHASHLFRVRKPDPAIYRRFEEETGFTAGEILFFDDRPENIAAARTCGWHAVEIAKTHPAVEQIRSALHQFGIEIPSPV